MLEPISVDLNKADLKKDLSNMGENQKMIDLPVFEALKLQVEQRICDYPDLVIQDIKFSQADRSEDSDFMTAVVFFKSVS